MVEAVAGLSKIWALVISMTADPTIWWRMHAPNVFGHLDKYCYAQFGHLTAAAIVVSLTVLPYISNAMQSEDDITLSSCIISLRHNLLTVGVLILLDFSGMKEYKTYIIVMENFTGINNNPFLKQFKRVCNDNLLRSIKKIKDQDGLCDIFFVELAFRLWVINHRRP